MKRYVVSGGRVLISLLYPPHCPLCDGLLPPVGRMACLGCEKKLPRIRGNRCLKCGREVSSAEVAYCLDCRTHPHVFDQGLAVFRYKGTVRDAIIRMKRGNRSEYAGWFAACMAAELKPLLGVWRPDEIIPVPMVAKREHARGYNQARLLADRLSEQTGVPCSKKKVRKTKDTQTQKKLSRAQRRGNLRRAFAVTGDVKGKRILVVDDVFTTGSTVDAMAQVLKQAGAAQVCFCTACMVDGA